MNRINPILKFGNFLTRRQTRLHALICIDFLECKIVSTLGGSLKGVAVNSDKKFDMLLETLVLDAYIKHKNAKDPLAMRELAIQNSKLR